MGVMDKMMEFMMPRMMRKMQKWMADAKPEDMENMMGMMHESMESCFSEMDAEELSSTMHDMMPKMMEGCFSKMSREQREGMLHMCRDMLDEIEEKYSPRAETARQV